MMPILLLKNADTSALHNHQLGFVQPDVGVSKTLVESPWDEC